MSKGVFPKTEITDYSSVEYPLILRHEKLSLLFMQMSGLLRCPKMLLCLFADCTDCSEGMLSLKMDTKYVLYLRASIP
jgi:hypothetical protein